MCQCSAKLDVLCFLEYNRGADKTVLVGGPEIQKLGKSGRKVAEF